jgi:cytochrome P450
VRVRKALVPDFTAERVETYRNMSVPVTDRMIDELPVGQQVELRPRFESVAQEMIIRITLGLDDRDQREINLWRDCLRRLLTVVKARGMPEGEQFNVW